MADQMKAWQYHAPGPAMEKLEFTESAPKPTATSLSDDQVLVRVKTAAINPADYKATQLGIVSRALLTYPKTTGMDLSGEVIAIGPSAKDVKIGDHVAVRLNPSKKPGSLSEYIIADSSGYAVLSSTVDLDAAACLGTAGLTAYQSIYSYIKPGDNIFINGGSGGVGTLGIQIGKLLGCHVTTSCSTPKIDLCKEMGADEIIDYRTTDVVEALQKSGRQYNLVLDFVGTSPKNLHVSASTVLTKDGVFIIGTTEASLAGAGTAIDALIRPGCLGGSKHKVVAYVTENKHEDMVQLASWLDQGKLKIRIDKTFEFAETKTAYEYIKQGSTAGKVVVHVA